MPIVDVKHVPVGPQVDVKTEVDGTPLSVLFNFGDTNWVLTADEAHSIGTQLVEASRLMRELKGDPQKPRE